eukprot:324636_1
MPDSLLLLVLLVSLIKLRRARSTSNSSPLVSAKYSADPLFKFEEQILHPGTFKNLYHIEPVIFIQEIVAEILPDCGLPRNYLCRPDYSLYGYVRCLRKCQINNIDRICRMVLVTRNVSIPLLSYAYNQSISTTYKDYHHITLLFIDKLGNKHVSQIIPFSAEYYRLIGQKAFRHFPQCLYSWDIVKSRCSCPSDVNHTIYFDGHNREYNYGFGIGIDCEGQCRVWSGHCPGSVNDIGVYYASDLYLNPGMYFGPGTKMITDGIFARVDVGRFIVPVCYVYRQLTAREQLFNMVQSWDRAIVENYINRLKFGCPLVEDMKFGKDKINAIFLSCLILTNIRVKQNPLRRF